jgi:flagellar hook-associated protein 3 FlgL
MTTISRSTQSSLAAGVMANLQQNLDRLGRLQAKLSSGKEVARPSDSPVATGAALRYRSDLKASEQHLRNADDAIGWLGTIDSALTSSLGVVRRVRELALAGGNATADAGSRNAMAQEVDQLREQLIGLANTTYLNRPVFAGTADVPRAYDLGGNLVGDVASSSAAVTRTVAPGVRVQINVVGLSVFGTSAGGLLKTLGDIADHLRTNPAALPGDISIIDANFSTLTNALSDVGARYNRIEAMQTRAQDAIATLRSGLSEVEDIDLPKTTMDLQLQQVAYQAALNATAKVIQPSLLDFLR